MLAEVRSLAPSDLHVSVPQGPQAANLVGDSLPQLLSSLLLSERMAWRDAAGGRGGSRGRVGDVRVEEVLLG